jgi:hypothetical protein
MAFQKTEIARHQIGTALALFIEDCDPVSVHTLACVGAEIAEHPTRKAEAEPFSTHALATFPDLNSTMLRRIRNKYYNAFKHASTRQGAERNDQELLERFNDQVNDHVLLVGWYDNVLAVGALPIEAQVFQAWYFAPIPRNAESGRRPHKVPAGFPEAKGEIQSGAEKGSTSSNRQIPTEWRAYE